MKEFIKNLSGRKSDLVRPALLVLFLSLSIAAVRAQGENKRAVPPEAQRELDARRRNAGGGLLRALNLTPEQRAQIVAIRRETEPQGRLLGARLRQARRALDEAIYSADPDDAVIEDRVRELGAAQTAVVRLRSLTELRIRRVLSPAQLDAFRRLQRQTRTRPRRMDQLPRQEDDLPGDPPARFRNRRQRRTQEQQQQQRLLNEQNTPPAPREPSPAPSRGSKP